MSDTAAADGEYCEYCTRALEAGRELTQGFERSVMLVAHRIRLNPNKLQVTYLTRAAGTARFAYNWALTEWQRMYEANKTDSTLPKPNEVLLCRKLNSVKREQFPWMLEVTKNAPQMAIIQLGRAFENFFRRRARYPTFRKKGCDDRFSLTNDQFRVQGKAIRIPKLGWVRMRERLRFTGHIVSAAVSRSADRWYASITVDTLDSPLLPSAENQGAVGVDLGVTTLATLSNGETITGPKALRTLLERLRRLGRALSRKSKGSRNRGKAKIRLAKLHAKIANIRRESLHQFTTSLTRRFHTIGIEDLNVKGMMANRHLSRAIADMGFGELRRQLKYKAAWRGIRVVVVNRWYPSSRLCSCCGHLLDTLGLDMRRWTCPSCMTLHERDFNAAKNLENMAVSSTVSACGGEGAGPVCEHRTKPAPMKQESNGRPALSSTG